jgi:hypothetical protein
MSGNFSENWSNQHLTKIFSDCAKPARNAPIGAEIRPIAARGGTPGHPALPAVRQPTVHHSVRMPLSDSGEIPGKPGRAGPRDCPLAFA